LATSSKTTHFHYIYHKNQKFAMARYSKKYMMYIVVLLLLNSCLPKPAFYPYQSADLLKEEVKQLSDDLESYLEGWLKGKNSKDIPNSLLIKGIRLSDNQDFYLQKFEEINPETQWAVRPAKEIDFESIKNGIPDPHVTYLTLGTAYAPFGSKLVIEGEFPYCRFFSIQISPPFDGLGYTANYAIGTCENSIVDADIEPLPNHENPFRPHANRLGKNRKYKVEFDLVTGNALEKDKNFKPPYRGTGSRRAGSLMVNQGPWWRTLSGKGAWNRGLVWIRYYAPDKDKGSLAGVPLPKAYYQLPTGEKYYINANFAGFVMRANTGYPAQKTPPKDPDKHMGMGFGWNKSFGILQSIGVGIYEAWGGLSESRKEYIRKADLGATGRGENQPPPHNYEPHATTNNYATYLGRAMNLGKRKVIVLTGKMPTFPNTRQGSAKMDTAMVRYWSIGGYDFNPFTKTSSGVLHSLMDDEVILGKDRSYIIAYSRLEDKPQNATRENGITWADWGPITNLGLLMRWVSVLPEWGCAFHPHEENLPWKVSSIVGTQYDPKLLGSNDHKGFMGEYLPKIHYMSVEDFEKLGKINSYKEIPLWRELKGNGK
jgi:hypothetical protein